MCVCVCVCVFNSPYVCAEMFGEFRPGCKSLTLLVLCERQATPGLTALSFRGKEKFNLNRLDKKRKENVDKSKLGKSLHNKENITENNMQK